MKNFLPKTQIRQLQIYEYLEQVDDWVELKTLMSTFRVSRPTLLADIDAINQLSDKFKIVIYDKRVKISANNIFSLVEIVNKFIYNNIHFEIIRFLITCSDKSVQDLADAINASPPATYRYIDQLNSIFQYNHLDIRIEKFPCHISGDEQSVRYFLVQYLKADIDFMNKISGTYQPLIQAILTNIFPYVSDRPIDYSLTLNLKLFFVVNLLRLRQNFNLTNIDFSNFYSSVLNRLITDDDLINLSKEFAWLDWNLETLQEILNPLCNSRLPLLNNKFRQLLDEDFQESQRLLLDIEIMVNTFAREFDIPLTNPKTLSLAIYNDISLYDTFGRSYAVIYNRFNIVNQTFVKKYSELYNYLWKHFKALSMKFFDQVYDELIIACILSLTIHWDNLLFYIARLHVPIKVLLINPLQPFFVENLNERLKLTLTKQLEIHVCPVMFPDISDLKNFDYDILISNTVLPEEIDHDYLVCLNIYDPYFIHELRSKVLDVRDKRHYEIIEKHNEVLQNLHLE